MLSSHLQRLGLLFDVAVETPPALTGGKLAIQASFSGHSPGGPVIPDGDGGSVSAAAMAAFDIAQDGFYLNRR